jgi:Tfp pilus assembly protein PilF
MKPIPFSRAACLGVIVLLLAAGCAQTHDRETQPVAPETRELPPPVAPATVAAPPGSDKAKKELRGGIARYENGHYNAASRQLRSALAQGLDSGSDEARAHKYLAFIHCVSGQKRQCRDEFRKALDADPAFDLTAAEAGHPTWGPLFRKLKAAGKPVKK